MQKDVASLLSRGVPSAVRPTKTNLSICQRKVECGSRPSLFVVCFANLLGDLIIFSFNFICGDLYVRFSFLLNVFGVDVVVPGVGIPSV